MPMAGRNVSWNIGLLDNLTFFGFRLLTIDIRPFCLHYYTLYTNPIHFQIIAISEARENRIMLMETEQPAHFWAASCKKAWSVILL